MQQRLELRLPPHRVLTDQEVRSLLFQARRGDRGAREELVNCNLRLVASIVQRFANRGYELEDLFQIGCVGLVKAVDKFDTGFAVKFSTYAVPLIMGEIQGFLRDDHPIKIGRSTKEAARQIRRVQEEMANQLGREPTLNEVAARVDLPPEELVAVLDAVQTPVSLQEVIGEDDQPIFLEDQMAAGTDASAQTIESLALQQALAQLGERDRRIVQLRFFQGKTQSEVAGLLGLSQVQVCRLEKKALLSLRGLLG
ncbi:MAG: SigB/SigF/SigG family RNA polymerase sigma factor [Firmicutes bacterium]|nr:SigB/SigF/SigG family RNA polymerase sigma factor [Bacillota bacterium]